MNKTYNTEAIILSRRNYSEADRILTLYSKNLGKITTIAKGVRKPSSRKRGSLEIFSQIRFSAVRGKGMDLMTEVEIVDDFGDLRNDLRKVTVAYFLVETINKATADAEENKKLYEILMRSLAELNTSSNLKQHRLNFIQEVLIDLGFWPEGRELKDHDMVLESVLEKPVASSRIGKTLLT